jgi:hypothetical protein
VGANLRSQQGQSCETWIHPQRNGDPGAKAQARCSETDFQSHACVSSLGLGGRCRGDVLLDVTLKEDGSVNHFEVIDGHPLLADAATTAVRQWRYQTSAVSAKPVRFIVLVSFNKQGKVR